MVVVPAAKPVTTPVAVTVAAVVVLLLHERAVEDASARNVLEPAHTESDPVIGSGSEFTVILRIAAQPVDGKV